MQLDQMSQDRLAGKVWRTRLASATRAKFIAGKLELNQACIRPDFGVLSSMDLSM